jgi:hypothetical protein
VADGIDTAVDRVKAPNPDSMVDRAAPEAELDQLPARDCPVLSRRQRGQSSLE